MLDGFASVNFKILNICLKQKNHNMEENTSKESSGELKFDKLAVIIQTKDKRIFQVALNQEMGEALFSELRTFFDGGIIKILPNEIEGITLEEE